MFAFTDMVVAWLFGKGYERLSKKKIGHYTWFFLLIGAILPDADFLIDWIFGTEIHRTFTHSFLFVITAPLLVYSIFTFLKNKDVRAFSLAFAAGLIVHLLTDIPIGYGVPLFWPNLTHYSIASIGYYDPGSPSFLNQPAFGLIKNLKLAVLDMALGTTWIFYLWYKKKLRFS